MGVEHHMAKMTAHGVQITGEGFGGTAELSQTDVAGALAGLNGPTYWYMRLKFCGDTTMIQRLRDAVAFQMLGEAMVGDSDVSAKVASGLAIVSILQATQGPVCSSCNGTGTVITKDSAKDCPDCRGTGRLPMTQARAARIAGVSTPTYTKKYAQIVDRYIAKLESYEGHGLSHVRRQIYDEK